MRRAGLSRPARLLLRHELLSSRDSYFDYGCGRGDDLRILSDAGHRASGWDPHHLPDAPKRRADVVNLGYVVNVIEDPDERARTLAAAWKLATRLLVISARLTDERDEAHIAPLRDGWVTRHGTFQRFYEHDELGQWINSTLDVESVAAGLGVYYVFRDSADREAYLASRFRRPVHLPQRRTSDAQFEQDREAIRPLMGFVENHGRIPVASELPNAEELVAIFGSLRRAFRVVLVVTDDEGWNRVRRERSIDLLVHLALMRFHGRPRWTELPDSLQRDVRAFYPSYAKACDQADRLLFACGNGDAVRMAMRASTVGKRTGNALYVHASALNDVPALLRVYEGCARALVGTVEEASVVKLHAGEPGVSYLAYPDFEKHPHPALDRSVYCDLVARRVRVTDYAHRDNPPILHRKEEFVSVDHPLRAKFARLTSAEERAGLYDEPEKIGTRDGWVAMCDQHGIRTAGHRIVRR